MSSELPLENSTYYHTIEDKEENLLNHNLSNINVVKKIIIIKKKKLIKNQTTSKSTIDKNINIIDFINISDKLLSSNKQFITLDKENLEKNMIEVINLLSPNEENIIFNHFQNRKYIKGLITLYQSSQMECSRSSGLTPEVGSSREKDLISSFVSNFELNVNYNITNDKEEDVIINDLKLSIKHSSNKSNTQNGIKIIWTVDSEKRKEFLKNFTFNCNIIIVYVRFSEILDKGELEIIFIKKDKLSEIQYNFKSSDKNIFKCLDGNSRGVEFDKGFFQEILNNLDFHIKIKFTNMNCNICNPISKRVNLLNMLN